MAGAVLGAAHIHLRMTHEIVFQTVGDIFALRHDAHTTRHILQNLVQKQRIMGAAEDDGVYLRVAAHQIANALFHEIVGTWTVIFVVFYQRHPHGAWLSRHGYVGIELVYLHHIALALDGSGGSNDAHVARLRDAADTFRRGTYHAEHTAVGVYLRQVILLYRPQGFGGGGVAGEDDEMASHAEQFLHCLTSELIYDVERPWTIRSTGVVAEIEIVVLRQQLTHLMKDGQSAIAGIEHSDRTCFTCRFNHSSMMFI